MTQDFISIRAFVPEDWPMVRAIYEEGIATGHATFETMAPEWEVWDAGHLKKCRFVALEYSRTIGWAALSGVSMPV